MGIDALNNAMGVQVQAVTPVKPVTPPAQTESFDSVEVADPAAKLDGTTAVVTNAQQKGDSGNDNGEQQQGNPTNDQIRKAVEQINKGNLANSEAIFGIHEKTNRVTIKIVDKETKEVIKELPPEKTLDMIAKAWELAGILVDEKR